MSRSIDERVVQMGFDNKQFESGVSETLSTLDKLKKALNFESSTKDLSELGNVSKRITFDSLSDSVQKISDKFSALGIIGITALQRIANQAIDTGEKLVKSLSVDQINAGYQKYNEATANVQTLMNATGKSQEAVYEYLDKLMWYSDETSYGFTDMTSALATMTSTGGDIENLIPLLEGVANATAYAGKGASEYSRIMQYAITQAYSAGSLTYMDWKTIQGAGVGSVQLQKALIEAGEELGTINKGLVTTDTFVKSIQANGAKDLGVDYKWVTTDVMEKAFGKFSAVTEDIYTGIQSGKFETYAEGLKAIGDKYGEVALKAAKSSQEAKTFQEAIDATKDAVSSGWMRTFELVFGRYEVAVQRWTQLCNDELWELFASSSETRNDILSAWAEEGGSEQLWQGIINIFEAIKTVIEPIRNALSEVFNFGSIKEGKETLLSLTESFEKFTEKLILSKDRMNQLQDIFEGVFSVLKIGIDIIKGGIVFIGGLAKAFWDLAGTPISLIATNLGQWIDGLKTSVEQSKFFTKSSEYMKNVVIDLATTVKEKATAIKNSISDAFSNFKEVPLANVLEKFKNVFEKIHSVVKSYCEKIREAILALDLEKLFNAVLKGGLVGSLIELINSFDLDKIVGGVKEITDSLTKTNNSISGVLDSVKDSLTAWQRDIKVNSILKIAGALAILAISLVTLASLNYDELGAALASVTTVLIELVGSLAIINKISDASSLKIGKGGLEKSSNSAYNGLIKIAVSLLLVATALKKIGELEPEQIGMALISTIALMASLVGAAKVLENVGDFKKTAVGLLLFAAAMVVLAEAVNKFGSMEWQELLSGIIGFGATLAIVLVAVRNMPPAGDLLKVSVGLILLGKAMKVFAEAIHEMGGSSTEDLTELVTGLGAVIVLLAALAGFIALTKNSNSQMVALGASMILVAKGIEILSDSVIALSKIEIKNLAAGLISVAVLLVEVGVAMKLMQGSLLDAAAFTIMAVGIGVLAASLKLLSSINHKDLGASLVALAAGLTVFLVAAAVAQNVALGIAVLDVGLLAFGAALVVVGAGLTVTASGLAAFSVTILELSMTLATVIEQIMLALDTLAVYIPMVISDFIVSIIEGATNIQNAIIDSFVSAAEKLANGISNIFRTVIDSITYAIESLGKMDYETLKQGLAAIAISLGLFIAAGYLAAPVIPIILGLSAAFLMFGLGLDAVVIAIGGAVAGIALLAEKFPWIKEKITDAIDSVKNAVNNIKQHISDVFDKIGNFFSDLGDKIENFGERIINWAETTGKNILLGLLNGIKDSVKMLISGVVNIARSVKNAFCEELGIHSPSKVFEEYGGYLDEGLVKGLLGSKGDVTGSISEITDSLTASLGESNIDFYNAGSGLGMSLTDGISDYSAAQTITPVVDLDGASAAKTDLMKDISSMNASIESATFKISDIDTEQTIEEHISFDTLKIEGVNNKGEFIASANYAVDEIISRLLKKEARL